MDLTVTRLDIAPSYEGGFLFAWEVDPAFRSPGPWKFQVYKAETAEGPWDAMSPELVNQFLWRGESRQFVATRDPVFFFKVRMWAAGQVYDSASVMPYGSLNRRDYLLAQEIQRKELLLARVSSGTDGQVWVKSLFGPGCTYCTDVVTGDPITDSCAQCYGTGRIPGYHGPYDTRFVFSTETRKKGLENDNQGVHEHPIFKVRMIGFPRLKKDDVIVDAPSDRRYYVDLVTAVAEFRRIPVVQELTVNEITRGSAVYALGTPAAGTVL